MSTKKPTQAQSLARLAQYVTDQRAVKDSWEAGNRDHVADCRAAGASWAQVAKALRVSRQAAHEHYGPDAPSALI